MQAALVQVALVQVALVQVALVRAVLELAVLEPGLAVLELAEPVAQAVAEPVAVRLVVAAGIPRWTEPPLARRVHREQVRCRRIDRLSSERSQLSICGRSYRP
ncbi:hypothetical protein [Bradyrhizobium sp. OAE829]|uniref:hypothetical protein n=1 Tax=Bradyrhizobium sp. OAE829 TaxID=2663807 RepID=UPI00178AF5FA